MKSCRIVSAPLNGGKTTFISKLLEESVDRKGFLSIKDNVGYSLENIETGERRRFLSINPEFKFKYKRWYIDYSVFDWGYSVLSSVEQGEVFLDEAGMLEVEEKGYFKIIKRLMEKDISLTIAVRTEFVSFVVDKFSLFGATVVLVPWKS